MTKGTGLRTLAVLVGILTLSAASYGALTGGLYTYDGCEGRSAGCDEDEPRVELVEYSSVPPGRF